MNLYDETVSLSGYPMHVRVEEAGIESAATSKPLYVAMGRDHTAWAYTSPAGIRKLIDVLNEALRVAEAPYE
jgi:hypothetical protein